VNPPTDDDFVAAGIYDPGAPDAARRLEFLRFLTDECGATVDDIVAAGVDAPILPASLLMWPDRQRFTLDEVVARTGIPEDDLRRIWRAAGFPDPDPDEPVFTGGDVDLFGAVGGAGSFFDEEVTMQLTRVIGAAAWRTADSIISAFTTRVGRRTTLDDPSGLELARLNAIGVVALDTVVRAFDVLLRHQMVLLQRKISTAPPGWLERGDLYETQQLTVGFVDLVDSTRFAGRVSADELATALARFDALASEVVHMRGGHVVKMIGDAVMFVAADASAALHSALVLVDTLATDGALPPARAGLTTGEVVLRDGDYYGGTVNTAARVAKLADPGSVLATAATRDALAADAPFAWHDERVVHVTGVDQPVTVARCSAASDVSR
jgi:adenylate cyclase